LGFPATGIDLIALDVKKPGTMLCPPGQYFPDNLSSCTVCDAGSYCLGGNFYKITCANGNSPAGSTSQASCTCNAGFGGGDGKCMLCSRNACAAGSYTVGCGGTSEGSCQGCAPCDAGFYNDGCLRDTSGTCAACPPDTFALGQVVCSSCDAVCGEGTFAVGCGGASQGSCQACGDCAAGQFRAGCTGISPGTCEACTGCEVGEYTAGCSGRSGPGACETCLEGTYALEAGLRINACLPCLECSGGMVVYDCTATTGPGTCGECPAGQYTSGGRCGSCCPTLFNRKYETAAECLGMARVDVEGQGAGAVLSVPSVADTTIVDGCVSGGVSYNAAWTETAAGVNGTTEIQRSVDFTCSCALASCPLGEFPTGGGACASCCQEGQKTQDSCESLTAPAKALLFVLSWDGKVRAAGPSGRSLNPFG